ncbi:GxxExxY protein [Pedobacter sp. SG918]|nr:GxxExxY protein [Pedobacter sp. SG918]
MNALKIKLQQAGLNYTAEKEFSVVFERIIVGKFRCDLFVEDKVIVELKSVTGYQPKLFQSQLISYLKASKIKTGLLINFGNTSCEVKRLSI